MGPASSAAATQASAPAIDVSVHEGLLTVDVRDAPLAEVLRVIGERANLRINIRGAVKTTVTQSFTELPLGEGIRRLVRGYSLALFYESAEVGKGLTEVWVMESSSAEPERRRVDARERASHLRAVQALARRRDEAAAAQLAGILANNADPIVRGRAAVALGNSRSPQAASALTTALGDPVPSVRVQAIRALRRVEGDRAVEALRGVLIGDRDPGVRRAAAQMLGSLSTEQARRALESVSSDPDASVRREVARALARWRARTR